MIEPNESGKGYEFINKVTGGAIPKEFIPCIDQGIQGAMLSGVLAGYQVVDVKCTVLRRFLPRGRLFGNGVQDLRQHGFQGSMPKAGPTLLEPIMKVVVTAPDEYMGDVMGDINARRGQISRHRHQKRHCYHREQCSAFHDVRLCYRPAQQDPGQRLRTAWSPATYVDAAQEFAGSPRWKSRAKGFFDTVTIRVAVKSNNFRRIF